MFFDTKKKRKPTETMYSFRGGGEQKKVRFISGLKNHPLLVLPKLNDDTETKRGFKNPTCFIAINASFFHVCVFSDS